MEVYRMGVGSGMCLTASLQEDAHAASEGSWLDSSKAVGVHLGQCSSEAGAIISWSVPGSVGFGSAIELGGHD